MEDKYFEEKRIFEQKRLYDNYKRNRFYTLYGILLTSIGLTFLLTKDLILNFVYEKYSVTLIIAGAFSLATGVGLLLYRYLQSGIVKRTIESSTVDNSMRNEIENIRLELMKLKKQSGTFNDTENLNTLINNVVNNTITEDFVVEKIDKIYDERAIEQSKVRRLYETLESLTYRIDSELARLSRSANLNLVIGTLTTTMAIAALGFEVFKSKIDFGETVDLLSHYLPRLSLVVFIEIFAFFFLKLYKANLQDIKYFNNEKTNIDFKLIALKTAIHQENPELIKLTIEELVKTERNFKLNKDESTVELEKSKLDKENNKLLSQLLGKLTDKL